MTAMPCSLKQQQEAKGSDPDSTGAENWASPLPQDPMTDHSETAHRSRGGGELGRGLRWEKEDIERYRLRLTPLEDYSPNITQLMEKPKRPRGATGVSIPQKPLRNRPLHTVYLLINNDFKFRSLKFQCTNTEITGYLHMFLSPSPRVKVIGCLQFVILTVLLLLSFSLNNKGKKGGHQINVHK